MVKRFVLATNLAEFVLRKAAVSEELIQEMYRDIGTGMHHTQLDEAYKKAVDDDFRIDRAREWAKHTTPFVESIIAKQVQVHLGLSAGEISAAWPPVHMFCQHRDEAQNYILILGAGAGATRKAIPCGIAFVAVVIVNVLAISCYTFGTCLEHVWISTNALLDTNP